MTIAGSVAKMVRRLGVDLRRVNIETSPFLRLVEELKRRDIKCVLDVGANDGGFAADLIDAGFDGRILSFEPLPAAWSALRARAAKRSPSWQVGPRVALSDQAGSAIFHEAGNSVSSSLLEMARLHEEAAPGSAEVRSIEVQTCRLDDLLGPLGIEPTEPLLLKIDVQGAERMVLDGASEALRRQIVGVKLEMSLVELYRNQPLWLSHHTDLEGLSFSLWDIDPGFRDARTGQLMQFDGVYFRD